MTQPSIFLSHNSNDKSFARRLGDELQRAGAKVWIDEAEIKLGDSLIRKIGEGIEACDYLAIILSPHSVASEWVRREVELAMNKEIQGKRVVVLPLLFRKCEIPIFLSDKLYADFTTPEKFIPSLNLIKSRLCLPLTSSSLPADEPTEDILHQIRSPIRQAQEQLRRIERDEDRIGIPRQHLAPVLFLVKRAELVLSRFRLLQAYSKGQYALHPRPAQDVLKIIQDVITYLEAGLEPSRNIRILLDAGSHPKASLDREFFEIAVANLLDNALRYSFSNSTVRVICSQDKEFVQVSFINTGLPINEFDRDSIFQQGFRGKEAKSVTGEGTGLGLYLAQQIMMSHGGVIQYRGRSTPNDHEFIMNWPKQYSLDAA